MDQYLVNHRDRIRPNQVIHVRRTLSGSGQIIVKVGQVLEPHDVLGEDIVNVGFTVLNLAKTLGVSPSSVVKYLERPIGSRIYKGELLALKKGFLNTKVLTSPTDSIIEAVNSSTGEVRLKFLPKKVPLFSGVYGIVDKINQPSEVVIKTQATVIYGVSGSGKERFGQLRLIGRRDSLITKDHIKKEHRGEILIGGALIIADAVRDAVNYGVVGVITGGVSAKVARSIMGGLSTTSRVTTDIGFGLLVTEGYGPITMGEDIFEKVKESEGRYIFILGNENKLLLPSMEPDSIINIRKVALNASSESKNEELSQSYLAVGSKVRVIWPPFLGSQGEVLDIDAMPTLLPSGVKIILATVELKFKKIRVAINNLETI